MAQYLKDAVKTAIGNAHPITGVQLDSNKNLSSPAAYYKPNQGRYSFIDPDGSLTPNQLVFFQRESLGQLAVTAAFHNRYNDLGPVTWQWGDASQNTVSGWVAKHSYAAPGTYTITASATSTSAGAVSASVSVVVDTYTALASNTVAPVITGSLSNGSTLSTTGGTWTNAVSLTYQWYGNGVAISGATASSYVTQSSDVGHTITVAVSGVNSVGTSAPVTSAPTGAIT